MLQSHWPLPTPDGCQLVVQILTKAESIRQFPLKATPFKDDYAKEADYKQDHAEYKVESDATMACCQEWIVTICMKKNKTGFQ